LIVRGATGVVFGVVAFAIPAVTETAVDALVGAYALTDGVIAVIAATRARGFGMGFSPFVVEGALGVLAGTLVLAIPGAGTALLSAIVAAWSIMAGVCRIAAAVDVQQRARDWLLALSGSAGLALGLAVLWYAGADDDAVVSALGAYAGIVGIMLVLCGVRLRRRAAPIPA
jgi:uncharacterized membrane protein HdeD (DUF308 family)